MKKRFIFSATLVTLLLAACSKREENVVEPIPAVPFQTEENAVNFGAYLNRTVGTKAGWAGNLTGDTLKDNGDDAEENGFGVFGYYTDGVLYSQTAKPNFMYNQQVTYNSGISQWEYFPVKYWPNEFGPDAESEDIDRLSFFAYAPYVELDADYYAAGLVSGDVTSGIIGLSRNTASGDPYVRYAVNMDPDQCVDLCWGVAATDFTSSVDGSNNNVSAGSPFLNMLKPRVADKLDFNFKHALSSLTVKVDADVDVVSHNNGDLASGTYIYLREVVFEGFATEGVLNLNSSTARWYDIDGKSKPGSASVEVYDGRRDGREGVSGAADANEIPATFNADLVQSEPYSNSAVAGFPEGVTHTAKNLFCGNGRVLVIPNNRALKITLVYDVETIDNQLGYKLSDGATRGSTIENNITRTITLGGDELVMEAGKAYSVNLHLGMTSVKVGDISVSSWVDSGSANGDFPINSASIGSVVMDDSSDATLWIGESGPTRSISSITLSDGAVVSTGDATIVWSSTDTDVATVDAGTGAVTLVDAGEAQIQATVTYDGMTKSVGYTVYVNKVTAVDVTAPSYSISLPDGTQTATATLTRTNYGTISSWPDVSWSSDDTDVLTVSPASATATDGTATTTASAVYLGTATVTASISGVYVPGGGSLDGTADFTVTASLGTISLNSSAPDQLWVGSSNPSTRSIVSVYLSDETTALSSSDYSVSWGSDNTSVASVNASTGAITLGGSAGEATITATVTMNSTSSSPSPAPSPAPGNFGSLYNVQKGLRTPAVFAVSGTVSYKIYVNEVTSVSVSVSPSTILPSANATATATLTCTSYGTVSAYPDVNWTSSVPGYASVSPATSTATETDGVVKATSILTGAAEGTSTITAEVTTPYAVSSVSGNADITVSSAFGNVDFSASDVTHWIGDSVTPPTLTVKDSENNAVSQGDGTSGYSVSWTSGTPSVATVDSSTGAVTLVDAGSSVITASLSYQGSNTTASYTVYVNKVTGVSVSLSSSSVIITGTSTATATLTCTANGTISTYPTVAWTSGTTSVATVSPASATSALISSVVTASATATGVAEGSSNITATVGSPYASSDVSGYATLSVGSAFGSVSFGASSVTRWIGESVTPPSLTVTDGSGNPVSKGNGTTGYTVSYTSGTTSVATVDSSTGAVTLVDAGNSVITASLSYQGSNTTATYTVHVNKVTGVAISLSPSSIATSGTSTATATLSCTANGTPDTYPSVDWTSGTTSVATLTPASSTASVSGSSGTATTTITGVSVGTSNIAASVGTTYATSVQSDNADLTVSSAFGTVSLSYDDVTKWLGESVTIPTLTVRDSGNNIISAGDGTTGYTLSWSSASPSVATVNTTTGAVTLVGAGSSVITATIGYQGSSVTKSYTVYVNVVTAVAVTPATSTIYAGGSPSTGTLTATLTWSGNGTPTTFPTVNWSSGTQSVATISPSSSTASLSGSTLSATSTATAVYQGNSTITATVASGFYSGGVAPSGSATVTVQAFFTASFTSSSLTKWVGQSVSNALVVTDGNGSTISSSNYATSNWASSATSVATVSAGTITPAGAGSTTISVDVSYLGGTQSASFTLYENRVTGITLTPSRTDLGYNNKTSTLSAALTLNGGGSVNGTPTDWPKINWTSGNGTDGVALVTFASSSTTTSSPGTSGSVVATAKNRGTSVNVTGTIDSEFTIGSTVSGSTALSVHSAFRGLEVSVGALKWNGTGYEMTSSAFDLLGKYYTSGNLGVYYHRFSSTTNSLKYRLDGSTATNASISNVYPLSGDNEWRIPSQAQWNLVFNCTGTGDTQSNYSFSAPVSSTYNGSSLSAAWVKVYVNLTGSTYAGKGSSTSNSAGNTSATPSTNYTNGVLLIPDYVVIPKVGSLTSFSQVAGSAYVNSISYDDLVTLMNNYGCAFLPAVGSYNGSNSTWYNGGVITYCWSSTYSSGSLAYHVSVTTSNVYPSRGSLQYHFFPVRLVRESTY